jgi:flagellar transcriptional activator FlhC
LQHGVVCGACQPPSRAGKTRKAAARAAVQAFASVTDENVIDPAARPISAEAA